MVAGKGSEAVPVNQTSMELRSDREIVIARTFNGPARIVFDAWTRPELVKRWWAPRSHRVSVVGCDAAVRVGGTYRYVLRLDTGNEFAFSGEYIEVTPHSRLVYTQLFEPTASGAKAGDSALIITVTFDEHDGKTHLVSHSLCPSREVRDTILASGMEHGMRETMDQLDELVASLR
jgi:uncharacterized protein YndB with AHSA1/START domain